MSNFTFRPSARENVHLLGGFIGGTGSGKTLSALKLATGLAGGKKFAVIDTEARRALHYADSFSFDHGDLKPPFTPDAYLEAILEAESAGYPVAVVDSMSHEHAGEGGILDWHEDELKRMAGDDWKKREKVKFAAWIKPKMAHKKMLQRLLQLRMHLILCFRAEPKMKAEKKNGKTEFVDAGWMPICAKGLEFELTFSFLLSHEKPGLPDTPLKLPEPIKVCFPKGRPIDESCGEKLAAWAVGGTEAAKEEDVITDSQLADLLALMQEVKADRKEFLLYFNIKDESQMPASRYATACKMLRAKRSA